MALKKIHLGALVLGIVLHSAAFGGSSSTIGFGFGKELRENTDISQYELFWCQPLGHKSNLGQEWKLATNLETAAAIITESGTGNSAARFALMPQLTLSSREDISFILGVGVGFMAGDTDYTAHNLGGEIFLASKLGLWFSIHQNIGLGVTYYHQSNAGLYEYNAGLNIVQLSIDYRF